VGVNAEIVQDGSNGFLAESADEWVDALARLAGDAALRRELGRNARATVGQGFTAGNSAAKFAAVVDQVCR
jgi:glycosyltransferase involved in cell wall biosynthesis